MVGISNSIGAVMVVGGGIGGIQASLDLADLGYRVYLVEKNPSIGGIMAQLDKTFPTNDCSLCILAPKMVEAFRHPNIDFYTYCEVEKIDGNAGNFTVTILKKARHIDETKCIACNRCAEKCPTRVPDEYNERLNQRKAIYTPFPQAVPSTYVIDVENCLFFRKGVCQICEKQCEQNAIDYDQKDETIQLKVGAVILSFGVPTFDPTALTQYGYQQYQNVLSSIEFERVLNASGPFEGHVCRPSDHETPQKVLWVNCIGSRNRQIHNDYCSSVCCTYTIKEAIIAKEHTPDLNCTIMFIDIRTMGKGFEEYYLRAQELGINFIKGRVAFIEQEPYSNDLIINYENIETGEIKEEIFNLVVLSVGFQPSKDTIEIANNLGIKLNNYNFCSTEYFTPLETNRNGVFVSGTLSGPKDIPETVAEASGAAGQASTLLKDSRNSLITTKEYPPEITTLTEEPRIGVFICHCGINIGAVVKVSEVVEFSKTLPNVVYAEDNIYSCSQDTQEKIKKTIEERNLNRIVVASCTPRTHESLFQNTIREAGLNPYLFELANIREQCSWVHMAEPENATEKAKDIVAMAVSKAGLYMPIVEVSVDIKPSGCVIGGGVAGLTAALDIASQDFEVDLIEKDKELGGLVKSVHYVLSDDDPQKFLSSLIDQVKNHPKIKIHTNATIQKIDGYLGNFQIVLDIEGERREITSGTIVVATGGQEYKPIEYNYGESDKILTQQELEQKIVQKTVVGKKIVMIQCVGSRNDERPYCSRICCSVAIKNALKLKEEDPEREVTILYRDIRTYGFYEDAYNRAREQGIFFIRFDKNRQPELEIEGDRLKIDVNNSETKEDVVISPDLVILSAAILPYKNKQLSQMLKVPLGANGFFFEAHPKLRPVDFATDGVFVCGVAQSPKNIRESIGQAHGAASRALIPLVRQKAVVKGAVATINQELCTGCESCILLCPYSAITKDENGEVTIVEVLCKGCGVCSASCPKRAIDVKHFTKDQIASQIVAFIGGN